LTITALRSRSEHTAIHDLVSKVDPKVFESKFGASLNDLDALVQAKTVTINKLMHLVPSGTVDPTPFLYNSTMYTAAGLLVVGAIANFTIRPVNPKFMMVEDVPVVPDETRPPKFTYAVCVDGSEYGDAAFNFVLKTMNKETERLFIISIDLPTVYALNQAHWPYLPENVYTDKRQLLMKYAKKCKKAGADFSALMIVAPNIGDAICFAAKFKKADLLVLGSSGRKGIQTMLGTISKYCADNADCNIMFVKNKGKSAPSLPDEDQAIRDSELGQWERTHEEKPDNVQTPINIYEIKSKK